MAQTEFSKLFDRVKLFVEQPDHVLTEWTALQLAASDGEYPSVGLESEKGRLQIAVIYWSSVKEQAEIIEVDVWNIVNEIANEEQILYLAEKYNITVFPAIVLSHPQILLQSPWGSVLVDEGMKTLLEVLWVQGVFTQYSCQGKEDGQAYVMLYGPAGAEAFLSAVFRSGNIPYCDQYDDGSEFQVDTLWTVSASLSLHGKAHVEDCHFDRYTFRFPFTAIDVITRALQDDRPLATEHGLLCHQQLVDLAQYLDSERIKVLNELSEEASVLKHIEFDLYAEYISKYGMRVADLEQV